MGGVVELAQALFDSPVSKSSTLQSAVKPVLITEWMGALPLVLAGPLFDIIPKVLPLIVGTDSSYSPDQSAVAAAEYALWLTMDLLVAVLKRGRQRWLARTSVGSTSGTEVDMPKYYDDERAAKDAGKVLKCFRENPSPQTRQVVMAVYLEEGIYVGLTRQLLSYWSMSGLFHSDALHSAMTRTSNRERDPRLGICSSFPC